MKKVLHGIFVICVILIILSYIASLVFDLANTELASRLYNIQVYVLLFGFLCEIVSLALRKEK